MTPAFPQSALQYHSIPGSTGLSQDWFLLLEEERQCLKRQCLSQDRSGLLPNHGPDARAGLRAPLGVVETGNKISPTLFTGCWRSHRELIETRNGEPLALLWLLFIIISQGVVTPIPASIHCDAGIGAFTVLRSFQALEKVSDEAGLSLHSFVQAL